jgi:hypothetical protein
MSTLIEHIKALLPIFKSQHSRDEEYLCGAVDMVDLERRMRLVDRAKSAYASSMPLRALMP